MFGVIFNFTVKQEQPWLDHFFLLRSHEPYKKPYNDMLRYGFLAYMGLFSIMPVSLKFNATHVSMWACNKRCIYNNV